mmetsp:Transcript_2284/g.3142  ORF Transcript_2284/g.3142 Transcript_2284/m.3142 type:complete len:376 (+) Transcript_2284:111-1238(+)
MCSTCTMPKKTYKKESNNVGFGLLKFFALVVVAMWGKRTVQNGDPLIYMIPNALLYTPFRETTRFIWKVLEPRSRLPEKHEHPHIAEISREEFSMEALKECTSGFYHPCVVRGLFEGTPAMKKWGKKGYLNSHLGEFMVPYIRKADYGTRQDDRGIDKFSNIANDILTNSESKKYLFFPVKSRFQFDGAAEGTMERLIEAINKMVHDDLELSDRIWNGFATNDVTHKNFFGSQLIMGRGSNSTATTTGTGWHCAPGNNWFAQVAGAKRWYFMDPKYSSYMRPLRGGLVNMMAGTLDMGDYVDRLPLSYADIRAGDMLYNPDWYWHTIQNREGLSIGCPIREVNMTLSYQNNAQYTGIITMNKIAQKLGIDIGGYP